MSPEKQNRRAIRNESQIKLAEMLGQTQFGKGILTRRVKGATPAQLKAAAKQMLQGPNAIKTGS